MQVGVEGTPAQHSREARKDRFSRGKRTDASLSLACDVQAKAHNVQRLARCSVVKDSPANAGDGGSLPGSGRPPLEKEMAAHSSVLAWRILWTEEPVRLQSMGGGVDTAQ